MNRRFLIVRAHPLAESFVNAAGDRAVTALQRNGHDIKQIDLYRDGFDPAVSLDEWRTRRSGIVAELAHYADDLRWATDVVFVYPTWFGTHPAMLKGWFDRVWVEGVSYHLVPGSRAATGKLRNVRGIWTVTSHGSTRAMNMLQGEPGKHFVSRGLRVLCSRRCRVRWVAFYGNDTASPNDREQFLERVATVFGQVR
jgi:NAD(P)H dehydrogenase (quinone)